jgi:hypothetical protein
VIEEDVSDVPYAAASFGSGVISNDTPTHPCRLSVAIARTFGLCCGFGAIVGGVSWPPIAIDWNAKARRKRGS